MASSNKGDKKKPIQKEEKIINIWNEEEYIQNPQYSDKTHPKYNPKHFKLFGENKIAFAKELREHHPELSKLIVSKHGVDNFELQLAEVSAYFEIILDGTYTEVELEKLCGILLTKLLQSRTPYIFPTVSE